MIPPLVKRIVKTTGVVSAVVFVYLALVNASAGVTFVVSVAWMLANLCVWGKLITTAFGEGEGKKLKAAGWVLAKIGLLALGVVALNVFSPFSKAQAFAIVGGISLVFMVAVLKVLGARLTNRDVFSHEKIGARTTV
jgi:hypothetical protein